MPNLSQNHRSIESRVRRKAGRLGYCVRKSRRWPDSLDNLGEFMLIDGQWNIPVMGFRYDATLCELEEYLDAA